MSRAEAEQARLWEITAMERPIWERGIVLAGMDEVGRGPLAGPVVAACVVMPQKPLIQGIKDSKKIAEAKREQLVQRIYEEAIALGFGWVDNTEIDRINILNATKQSMRMAYEQMALPCGMVLVDGLDIDLPCPVRPVVKGDALSYSIAAASIAAKVRRDAFMREADKQYPEYGFARNKGYGTKEHMDAIRTVGPCPLHRRSFIRSVWVER
ncbi:MAG: ribonuclease HII [Christensenellales bacterium]|jgi:ribonuclease HII